MVLAMIKEDRLGRFTELIHLHAKIINMILLTHDIHCRNGDGILPGIGGNILCPRSLVRSIRADKHSQVEERCVVWVCLGVVDNKRSGEGTTLGEPHDSVKGTFSIHEFMCVLNSSGKVFAWGRIPGIMVVKGSINHSLQCWNISQYEHMFEEVGWAYWDKLRIPIFRS